MLSAEKLREVLIYDAETGLFTWRFAQSPSVQSGSAAGSLNSRGYWCIALYRRKYQAHRLAWLYVHGSWPVNLIDHINGKKTDNRITNLRDVTQSENQQNQRRARIDNKSSGLLGVSWDKRGKRWRAAIQVNRKTHYLGLFKTPEEAHVAYLTAKRQVHQGCTT